MEALLILLALGLVLSSPLALVVAVIALRAARTREQELAALRTQVEALASSLRAAPPATPPRAPAPAPAPAATRSLESPPEPTLRPAPAPALAPAPAPAPAPSELRLPFLASLGTAGAEPHATLPAVPRDEPIALEERLGARLPVWIGAIALTLAGAFLVKYSFDHGWITPGLRVALGLLFGAALLVVGELARTRQPLIGQGFTAAGIADLFAALLAGVHLYHLISSTLGFLALAATAATGVALSLRQGQLIAVIGLVGGFLTPALIQTENPDVNSLLGYLLVLQAGILAVAKRRGWGPLAAVSLLAGIAWALWIVTRPGADTQLLALGLFVSVSSLGLLLASRDATAATASADSGHTWGSVPLARTLRIVAALAGLLATGAFAARFGFGPLEWGFLALISAALLWLARSDRSLEPLTGVALIVTLSILAGRALLDRSEGRFDPAAIGWIALAFGGLFTLGGWLATLGSARRAALIGCSASGALGYFLVAWWLLRGEEPRPPLPWGVIALVLAALVSLVSLHVARRRDTDDDQLALEFAVLGATGLLSAAVPLELSHVWITVGWAIEAALLTWFAPRLRSQVLPRVAAVLAAAVLIRSLLNPAVIDYPIGSWPIVNGLLYGYGLPIAAFVWAAWIARGGALRWLAPLFEWGAWALGLGLTVLQVRQLWHPVPGLGFRDTPHSPSFAEGAALLLALALFGGLLRMLARRPALGEIAALRDGATGAWGLAIFWSLFGLALGLNPVWSGDSVGSWPVLNLLLLAFALPAALAIGLSLHPPQWAPESGWRALLQGTGLILALLCLLLQVRQLFQGATLRDGAVGDAEMWCYSLALLAGGTALLLVGIRWQHPGARYAALIVMLVAVAKVFLFDTGELHDLWRVVSYLGLGASLMLLAWLYRRFVFAARPR